MFTPTGKRSLESPENCPQDQKLSRTRDCIGQYRESFQREQVPIPISLSLSKTIISNMDERDKSMLAHFDLMLQKRFESFSQTHIDPVMKELTHYKEENVKLREEVKNCVERISFLEKSVRESNLIFSNVPASENHFSAVEDICKNILKVSDSEVDKLIPVRENKQQKTVTLLATFKSRRIADMIMKKAGNLRGTRIGVSRDLPREERMARDILLKLRRQILNTGTSIKIKVYGKNMYIDKEKLTLENNVFGNSKVDGRVFILEKFNIDFDSILSNTQ